MERDELGPVRNVCAVDVAYDDKNAYCSAVVASADGRPVESVSSVGAIKSPYIPGLLMLREAPPIFRTLRKITASYDLLLLDGHGQLHPRRCGIACYVGVMLDRPAIGIAKSLLCGKVGPDGSITLADRVLGQVVGTGKKRLYVSVGHRISLRTAVSLVENLAGIVEALRLADAGSKELKKRKRA